ncbi:nuclear transport factor 2 family protein [Lentzea sp. NPDC005914]|uniref:nuclear transport factor 2 family protein n=1 Tax=Lentzea sp. NPDC005914 TaxID=3154572 RepID=UPI0033F260FE
MTTTTGSAQKIADEFVHAWTGRDVEKALSLLADDVVCEAPGGRIEGVDGYRGFLQPFVTMITSATVIDVLGDDTHAAAVYTTDTPLVPDFRGIDHFTVENGKITHIICVFDRLPMHLARNA